MLKVKQPLLPSLIALISQATYLSAYFYLIIREKNMTTTHSLGFPRIGVKRQLKWALEQYWKNEISQNELEKEGQKIRHEIWAQQIQTRLNFISVGDFSWYDHVLDTSVLLGVIPERFEHTIGTDVTFDTYFRMARGRALTGKDVHACEMTKWFDTNYHYIVPEFEENQQFQISSHKLFNEINEAKTFNYPIKVILLGPLSYLWLGKTKNIDFNKLNILDDLLNTYQQIFKKLTDLGVEFVQIDEPVLTLDLPGDWQNAFQHAYQQFASCSIKLLLTTYFGGLGNNTELACQLPTAGLHIDAVRAPKQLDTIISQIPQHKILSIGIVDGRNIWRTNLRKGIADLKPLFSQIGSRLWISSSCSLLHSPVDLSYETQLDDEIKNWLAFAVQKQEEIVLIANGLQNGESAILKELTESDKAVESRKKSSRIHNPEVKKRCENINDVMLKRSQPYSTRQKIQKSQLNLPYFPTTTIGSFPQTSHIRKARQDYKAGKIDADFYKQTIKTHIANAIQKQILLGIDVLVHGEAERNDMVEYFGELLEGFVFTQNGWVQSYGSRCVKPPIIFGDVSRSNPMTTEWIAYAQSLTSKPVKGMLTGPLTILCWSFVRDDQSRFETAKQIALALRDEVSDLVKAGIKVIQIDEPAIREGLPLRKIDWQNYLEQAVYCFRLASCCVDDSIQIHTHMCYSEFNDIIHAISQLDADVITIENSRSNSELLRAFEQFNYPNDIGPGVYDIHSPRIPSTEEIVNLIEKAAQYIPLQQLWINPDCGLKTREWIETESALKNMVKASQFLREKYSVLKKNELLQA